MLVKSTYKTSLTMEGMGKAPTNPRSACVLGFASAHTLHGVMTLAISAKISSEGFQHEKFSG
jgi:hypothetical protein